MCPLTLAWDKPYSAPRSRCTTPEDCESIAVFSSGTKDGISGTGGERRQRHSSTVARQEASGIRAVGGRKHAPACRKTDPNWRCVSTAVLSSGSIRIEGGREQNASWLDDGVLSSGLRLAIQLFLGGGV